MLQGDRHSLAMLYRNDPISTLPQPILKNLDHSTISKTASMILTITISRQTREKEHLYGRDDNVD